MEIVAVLHNIRSVHNVGSIFRTADAAAVRKIYLCGITPSPKDRLGKWRKDFTKVSLGAEKYLDWDASARRARATLKLLENLKKEGYKIFAVEQAPKSQPYYKMRSSMTRHTKVVLVLGNEVKGLPPSVLKKADKILEIPMKGKKESLNVSVAFGIAVFGMRY